MSNGIGSKVRKFKRKLRYIRDENGEIIRRTVITEVDCEYGEGFPSDGAYINRYSGHKVIQKCRCGVYVMGQSRCCKCYSIPSMEHPFEELQFGTDRADMEAVDARFNLCMVSVDWMINNHLAPTIIVRDGRDQDHEDWWGG